MLAAVKHLAAEIILFLAKQHIITAKTQFHCS